MCGQEKQDHEFSGKQRFQYINSLSASVTLIEKPVN